MRIAITSNGRNISCDFDKTIKIIVFEVLQGKIRGKFMIDVSEGNRYETLKYILKNEEVKIVLCGRITDKIKIDLERQDIKVVEGVRGNINNVVSGYMKKN